MKRFVRFVSLILVLATVMTIPAMAAETENQRASNYFMSSSVYLWEASSTKLEIWFDVTAVQSMDKLGASTIELQRSTDKVHWTTVKTYDKADYSQMIADGKVRYANCVPYTYTSGYYYSATITLYAKKGNGTATSTVTTPILDLT